MSGAGAARRLAWPNGSNAEYGKCAKRKRPAGRFLYLRTLRQYCFVARPILHPRYPPFGQLHKYRPEIVLCIGLPVGVTLRFQAEFHRRFLSFRLHAFACAITPGSAFSVHRPRHLERLGPRSAGRSSTSELADWGSRPTSKCMLISQGCNRC